MMAPAWKPNCAPTMVGSMPHRNRKEVIEMILNRLDEIPVWPQLSPYKSEGMMVQYLEGLPGLIQEDDERYIFDTELPNFEEDLYRLYDAYVTVSGDESYRDVLKNFAFGPETGATFYAFTEALERHGKDYIALKGQVVGPFTLLSYLKDKNGRLALYNEKMQDVVPKHLVMKALWQAEELKKYSRRVIIFFDEPALAGYGSSAFISVSREFIEKMIAEMCSLLQSHGVMVGIHVCANTDWSLLLRSSVDIVNFDAYSYSDKFLLYSSDIRNFVQKGGYIAWGLVPTDESEKIWKESVESLEALLVKMIEDLSDKGLVKGDIFRSSLVTPSCGCGTLTVEDAEKVLDLLVTTVHRVRERFKV